jgi:monoamine oxidase
LPSRLADELPGNCTIDYNCAVTAIEVLPDGGTRLTTQPTEGEFGPDRYPQIRQGAESSSSIHDFVLCTLPFSVLRGMSLTGLSAQKMAAIRMMNYESSTKVMLLCSRRRWEAGGIAGGATMSDTILRSTYYPSDHQEQPASGPMHGSMYRIESPVMKDDMPAAANPAEPGVLVASYSWGRDARRMAAMPHEQRVKVCVDVLEHVHPDIHKDVLGSASACWDNHPWARGAFALPSPSETPVHLENGRRPEGRLFFAGEHLSFNPGWIQGAIISALDAAEELLSYR